MSDRRIFAWLLVIVGIVWLLLDGGCTVSFLQHPIQWPDSPPQSQSSILADGLTLMIPRVILIALGLLLFRNSKK